MERIENILFPVDFSPPCRHAAPAVASMARKFDAGITLLHVVTLPRGPAGEWYAYLNLVDTGSILGAAQQEVQDFLAQDLEGLKVRRRVVQGEAVPSILEYAKETGTDLIMMPTRGQTRFRELLMGSVTSGVLHDAECPVWTSAHAGDEAEARAGAIVCAIDLEGTSVGVLRWARRLAEAYEVPLHVAHAIGPQKDTEALAEAARNSQARYAAIAREAGVQEKLEIADGSAAGVVCVAAARHKASLVVAGRGRIQGTVGRLRNNIHEIIRKAPCPVFSV
jgi:nucleotide-binding universal stress UspA family protein